MPRLKLLLRNFSRRNHAFLRVYAALSRLRRAAFMRMPDEQYIRMLYRERFAAELNLINPQTYNEKLQWMKLNDHNPLYSTLVDKVAVRDYVRGKAGDKYLTTLYGVYDSFDDIDFHALPRRFVLKCAHDSGSFILCADKRKLNLRQARRRLTRALRANYYFASREWPYKNAVPRVLVEEYLGQPGGEGLRDYKFFCFAGRAEYIQVHFNRSVAHRTNVYDRDWNYVPERFSNFPPDPAAQILKPAEFLEMLELAETLSAGLPHVRVDLYDVDGRVLFGEMTMYHAGGMAQFSSEAFARRLGDLIDLGMCKGAVQP